MINIIKESYFIVKQNLELNPKIKKKKKNAHIKQIPYF